MGYAVPIYQGEKTWRQNVSAALDGMPINPLLPPYNAAGDGTTDDTTALQAAFDAAANGTIILPYATYKTTGTLYVSQNTIVLGCDSTIDYFGTGNAIDFNLVAGVYPQNIAIQDLNVLLEAGSAAVAWNIRASHSRFTSLFAGLKSGSPGATGFALVGDDSGGTGPYYNTFINCWVQGQGTGQTGVNFVNQAPNYRAPNANTWVGGRVGQVVTAFIISGDGNTLLNPTVEGSTTAFKFDSGSAIGCINNSLFGHYVESCTNAYVMTANASGTGIFGGFLTGITNILTDSGSQNYVVGNETQWSTPTGLKFAATSSNASTLDYYGEGTWTPTLVGGTTAGSYSVSSAGAVYVRVGRMVTAQAKMTITVNSAGTGLATFGGLPFTKSNTLLYCGDAILSSVTIPAAVQNISVNPVTSSASSQFSIAGTRTGTTPYDFLVGDFATGSVVTVNFTYFTDT